MLCSDFQLVKYREGYEDVCPLPCRSWSCERCAAKRRWELKELAASGEPNKILTLTVNPSRGGSPGERRNMLHDAWKRLVKRIIRYMKWKNVPYMAFLEKTKAGEPHLHILLRCPFLPQRWISAQMAQMIGAPIVWIEQIKGAAQAIRYVTKYVTKAPAQFGNSKRYWTSQNWRVAPKPAPEEKDPTREVGTIIRRRWVDEQQARICARWTWKDIGEGWTRWYRPGVDDGSSADVPSAERHYWGRSQ